MEPIILVTILGWIFRLTGVSGYPGCCAVSSVGEVTQVACRGCGLDTVPQDLPVNATQLDLTNNKLNILQSKSFLFIPHLQTLILDFNGMTNISLGAFEGLENLRHLSLRDNTLDSSLGTTVFEPLFNLRVLDLQRNVFHVNKVYPVDALSHITSIETLSIDIFEQFSFDSRFLHLKKLTILNVYGLERCSIRNASFMGLGSVTHFMLRSRISFIEKDALSPFKNLAVLEIDSDRTLNIREVLQALYGVRDQTIEQIRSTRNFLPFDNPVKLVTSDILFLKSICLKQLYLIRNSISSISLKAITSWTSRNCLEVLDVSQNKFISLEIMFSLTLFPALTHFSLTNNIPVKLKRKRLSYDMFNLQRHEMTIFIPPGLIFLNISHNDIKSYIDNLHMPLNNSLRYFDISYQGRWFRYFVHGKGLVHLEELYVSAMTCSHVKCISFDDMPNLIKVEARQCSFGNDFLSINSTSVFNGLHNLTYVDLSANQIHKWDPMTFHDQKKSLKVLMISENELNMFPAQAIESLEALEYVDVSHNAISTLTRSDYNLIDRLKQKSEKFTVNLHGNPLACNCYQLDFLRWVMTTEVLYDKLNLRCATPHGDLIKFIDLYRNFDRFQIDCAAFSWLIVSILLLIVISVMVMVSLLCWRYSAKLRVWCRQPSEGEFSHYAFLSYSDNDSKWVRERLVSHLEQESLSFLCYDKDFEAGKDIDTNILGAIDHCYKSVFVVSYDFLNSEWTKYAMQVASGYAFRKGRDDMNIIILLDDIELSELPKLLRKNWDNVACLRWPQDDSTGDSSLQESVAKATSTEIKRAKLFKKLSKCIRKGNPGIVEQDEETLVSETML